MLVKFFAFFEFKPKNFVYVIILIFFVPSAIIHGQKMGSSSNENCDENKILVFRLTTLRNKIIEKHPEKDSNLPIIIIASLGTGEDSRRYSLQRLREVKEYLRCSSPLNMN